MARNDTMLSVKHGVVTACDPSAVEARVPEGVEDVGFMAFADCGSLTKVTLPESLRYIGSATFLNCTALSDIRFRGTRARWNVVRKSADWNEGIPARTVRCKDGAVLIGYAALEDGTAEDIRRTAREVAIPDGVTEIGMEAFMGFEALESVAIPESVRTIGCMAFKDCGWRARSASGFPFRSADAPDRSKQSRPAFALSNRKKSCYHNPIIHAGGAIQYGETGILRKRRHSDYLHGRGRVL